MKQFKKKNIAGVGWDDDRFGPHNSQILGELISELQSKYQVELDILEEETEFKREFSSRDNWDFVLLDIIDKKNHDARKGYKLASWCRAKNFANPVFLMSDEPAALLDDSFGINSPFFVFQKKINRSNIAFSIFNFLTNYGLTQSRIFLGHGRSKEWMKLKSFIQDKHKIECEEFNSFPGAGFTITNRIEQMKKNSGLAFLVMTAEDEQHDGTFRSRQNVVHEIGYFQGYLGFSKVIVLVEEGCEDFTNIGSIIYIPFRKGDLSSAFDKVEFILVREKFI